MAKLTLNTIGSRYGSIDALNDNSNLVEAAFENTLSRDGTGPNNMEADLDMDSNSIINVDEISASQIDVGSLLINGVPVAPTGLSFYGLGKETQVATSNQTVFTLGSLTYVQGINNIQVYVDGVYQNPSTYAETSTTSITFDAGLHVGAVVDFVLYYMDNLGYTVGSNATQYNPAGVGAIATNVQAKLRESVSLLDFGADPTGATPCSTQVQAAIDAVSAAGGGAIYVPPGTYVVRNIFMKDNVSIIGDGWASYFKLHSDGASPSNDWKVFTCADASGIDNVEFINVRINGQQSVHGLSNLQMHGIQCRGPNNNWLIQGCYVYNCGGDAIIVGRYNNYAENPPTNIRIIGNTIIFAGRQALAVSEGNGVVISGNYVAGPLDLEADSPSSKFYHCSVTGNVVRGNLNVNLYSVSEQQDNDTTITGNAVEFITLVQCNNVVVSGNTITTSLRYGTNANVLIEGCTMPIVEKIGGERSKRMVVRNCTIVSTATDALGFQIADVEDLIIDSCVISATGSNAQAIFHANAKSFTPTNDNIQISNCRITGNVRGVNVSVNSNFGVTSYKIDNCDIQSSSTNQVITKGGSGTAGGTFQISNSTVNNQVTIANCLGLVSLTGMRFNNAGSAVVLDSNTNAVFELDNWTFVTAAATAFMRNCTNIVSVYVGDVHSIGTSNSIALDFTSSTGTPTVWIDGTNATSTTWYGTVPGTVRTGSYYNLLGDATKRGQWYNGTSWTNIT